ncbi:hypothetical protein SSCHL_1477 [Staphylococcus schleiferi]|nr:hypothetical protein SSCHL_1477 [Staphylococcus schleiferi]
MGCLFYSSFILLVTTSSYMDQVFCNEDLVEKDYSVKQKTV